MKHIDDVEIAIIGSGIVGISTAYYLCKKYQCKSVLLIDSRDPMSYTTAQSGDNYRNWWPSQVMTQFTNHSISLMQEIARETSNEIQMKQRGYALASRSKNIDDLIKTLDKNYGESNEQVRIHNSFQNNPHPYLDPHNKDWASSVDGVDVISNKQLIQQTFPHFSPEIENVIHIRKAGDFSSQQMGQVMLQQIKLLGCSRLRGQLINVVKDGKYKLEVKTSKGVVALKADKLINAAGPYVADIATMLGVELPIKNQFHQKIAFEDHLSAVPRNQPFSIDIDEATLDWNEDEKESLKEDFELAWLTKSISGGIHSRPEGEGRWIKLGWAYNTENSHPNYHQELTADSKYNPYFPEIVLRGAAKLNPSLVPYIETLPVNLTHYGGYYTMTDENWPLIGPLDDSEAYVAGALSGFGCMGACAAGSLCADWVCQGQLPEYAHALSLNRYQDPELIKEMKAADIGVL